MNTAAKSIPSRNALIAKIHIGKNHLALNECSYRALLFGATGKESCADMDIGELEQVLSAMKNVGFKPKPKSKSKTSVATATGDQARKIRALWIMLYHLGQIADSSEEALAGFVKRQTQVESLNWLTPIQADQVIKALRGWLSRVGYYHPTAMDHQVFGTDGLAENISLMQLQASLLDIDDIYDWLNQNGFPCDALKFMDRDDMYCAIKILGERIRQKKKADHVR